MALLLKAGTAIKSGDPQNITIGFTPTAIFFWTPNATAENVWSNGFDLGYGVWAQTPFGVRQQAMWAWSSNGVNTSNVQAGLNPQKSIAVKAWSLAVSTITDGFKMNWGSSPPNNTRVHYLAFGGDAQANIITQTFPTSLNAGDIVQVRGALFQPTALIAIAQRDSTQTDKTLSLGVADDAGGQWAVGIASQDSVNPANTGRTWRETDIISFPTSSGGEAFRAQIVRMQPDGFDLLVINPPTATITAYFLCLRGMMARATSQAKPTGAAPATSLVASGFRPEGVLFAGAHETITGGATNNRGMVGAADVSAQTVGDWNDADAVSPTSSKGLSRTDASLLKVDNNASVTEAVATAALTASGATLTWSTNDAIAARFGAMAFGTLKNALAGTSTTNADALVATFNQPILIFGDSQTDTDLTGAIGAVALLGGDSQTDSDLTGKLLADTTFRNATLTTETDLTGTLALRAKLGGDSETNDYTYVSAFGKGVDLAGPNVTTTETDLTGKIGLGPKLKGTSTTETDVEAYLLLPLPEVAPTEPGEIAGTVNWHPNPSAEGSLLGWDAYGGGTVALDTGDAWDGSTSVLVTTGAGSAGQGVLIRGSAGLQLTGKARNVWSQVRVKGAAGTVLTTWTQIHYSDGTLIVGDSAQVTLTGGWDLVYAPAAVTVPSLILLQAEMAVVTTTAQALTFRVDGAQLEEDHGDGPTRIAIGGYSPEIGVWQGIPHRSVTLREPLLRSVKAPGRGGPWIIESFMYRATWDNQWIEDISDAVISATVTMDATRDVVWSLDATLTLPGWRRLTPYLDWVAPYMRITKPDGTVSEGQLGLYFVLDAPESRGEIDGTVHLSANDPLGLLGKQAFIGNFVARAGVEKMHAVRDIINGAVLTGLGAQPTIDKRYAIPDSNVKFKKDREITRKTSRLQAANDIARSAGFYPLYTTGQGIITTRKMGGDNEKRLRFRHPAREWSANVPPGWSASDGWIPKVYDGPSELVGTIDTTPKMQDLDNEIWLINDDPDDNKIFVQHHIRNHKNKRAVFYDQGRRKHRSIYAPFMDDQATAQEVADALADELSTLNTTISFSVLPDPSVALMHEVVQLAFFDVSADTIAGGRYAVHRVSYGFTPSDCLMKIDAGMVQNADDQVQQDNAA